MMKLGFHPLGTIKLLTAAQLPIHCASKNNNIETWEFLSRR